jgi:hypothetical protein
MSLIRKHDRYNPGEVLSTLVNRDEYDFLFSRKTTSVATNVASEFLRSVKDVGLGIVELLSGSSVSGDPSKAGELNRIATQYSAGFQALLGISKALTGDVYSGAYNTLLGVLGVSCSREGKSKDMLKTYTVITFINGCVQAMEVVQISLAGIPLFGHGMSAYIATGHVVSILNPFASFLGAYVSWQFIKAAKHQYLLALANYQLQMLMMQQQQQMFNAATTQQQAIANRDLKRLPPIYEIEDENNICREDTGGSENKSCGAVCGGCPNSENEESERN